MDLGGEAAIPQDNEVSVLLQVMDDAAIPRAKR
jgi:hypothetical protein